MTKRSEFIAEAETLRRRAYLILDAIERAEPNSTWTRIREITQQATSLNDLRSINGELRGLMGALEPSSLADLKQKLEAEFGPDSDAEKDHIAAKKAVARGRIRSEREYRAVQAYADSISGTLSRQDEFASIGMLLDEYASRAAT